MKTLQYDFLRCDYKVEATKKYLYEIVKDKYNDVNALQIIKACALANQIYRNQRRYDNVPFIIHPMRVALMLIQYDIRATSKVVIAALLHDTLEITCMTSTELEAFLENLWLNSLNPLQGVMAL